MLRHEVEGGALAVVFLPPVVAGIGDVALGQLAHEAQRLDERVGRRRLECVGRAGDRVRVMNLDRDVPPAML